LQTLSNCHELLHGPPQCAEGTEQGVPVASGISQSGSTGGVPGEPSVATPPQATSEIP
jgi:hypothetical protein